MAAVELVTLFGEELPEVSSARIGVRVAGGVKVSARDLASTLLAMAVADLHWQGLASVEEQDVKKLFRASRALMMRSSGTAEGFTGAVAGAARGGVKVGELARQLLGGMVSAPELTIIGMAHAYLEPTGAVVAKHGLKRLASKMGYSPYEIDEDGAQRLRGEWEPVRKQWEAWKQANGSLTEPLLHACRKAMGNARDTSAGAAAADFS